MRAQKIPFNGAQIIDLHNRLLCPDKRLACAVRLGCEFPTRATRRPSTGSRPNTEQILGSRGLEDFGREESAGDSVGIAVSRTIGISSAVSKEAGQHTRLISGRASIGKPIKPSISRIAAMWDSSGLCHDLSCRHDSQGNVAISSSHTPGR